MKTFRLLTLSLSLLICASAAAAQSYQLNGASERLARQSDELAERAYREYAGGFRNSRGEVETLFLAQQFRASAATFQRMVRDNRRPAELREAYTLLDELSRRADRSNFQRGPWGDVRRTLNEIERELNVRGDGGGGRPPRDDDDGRASGRMRWRGRVDDEVHVHVRGDTAELRAISGWPTTGVSFNFTSPLPRRRATVSVNKIRGRGDVQVIQQPSRDNDFTAVIQIRDPRGGASDYELELVW